jgi:hypothetical protein
MQRMRERRAAGHCGGHEAPDNLDVAKAAVASARILSDTWRPREGSPLNAYPFRPRPRSGSWLVHAGDRWIGVDKAILPEEIQSCTSSRGDLRAPAHRAGAA